MTRVLDILEDFLVIVFRLFSMFYAFPFVIHRRHVVC